MPRISDCSIRRGRWLLPVAALVVSVAVTVPMGTLAQRVAPEVPPVKVPGGGTGGGAGLLPPTPSVRSLPYIAPAPSVTPAPSVAPAAPEAPVTVPPAVVRFRCQLESGAEACKEPMGADGGGGDEECNCLRDYCRDDPAGHRVCEKQ